MKNPYIPYKVDIIDAWYEAPGERCIKTFKVTFADEKVWDKEDLMNLLHGHMPTFMLNRENYTTTAPHLLKTFQTVCEWNRAIGYEEMTDFRWLTPDGSVQQAVYASGRSMIVNFGDQDFAFSSTEKVPAKGFLRPAGR